jgi:hypothetical protein
MKCLLILQALLIIGCLQQNHIPTKPSPVSSHPLLIEINSVPPPFDLGGNNPYVVWMNGRKVHLPKEDLVVLVDKVGKKNIPNINLIDIHKGWLWPHFARREGSLKNTVRTRQAKAQKNNSGQ